MDAGTIVHYKNESRDWIYLDNDLCKTKETSKTFADANQSEYDSNVELFGEITIQFNNEVHLLYDGPVQIKCKNNSPDYKFNCNNLVNNPANEHNANISKSNDTITKQNTSIRNIDSCMVTEKFRIPTQPSITSKLQTKTIKQPAIKSNNSNISSNKTKPIRKVNNDDVCSRTSQFFIPRKTIISSERERLYPNTTVTPIGSSIASAKLSHSISAATAVNRTDMTGESEISNSIHARFAKLLQSNANSLHLQNINNIEINQEKKQNKLSMQIIKIPYEKHKDRILQVEKSELTITRTIVGPQSKDANIKTSDVTCSRVKEKLPFERNKPIKNDSKISSYNSKIIHKTTSISNKKSENISDSKDLKISCSDVCIVKTDSNKKLLVSEQIVNSEVINFEEKKSVKSINNKEKVTDCSKITLKEVKTAVQGKTKSIPDLHARKKTKMNSVIEKVVQELLEKKNNSSERKFENANSTDKNASNDDNKEVISSKSTTRKEVMKEPAKTQNQQTLSPKNKVNEVTLKLSENNKEESRLKSSNDKNSIAETVVSKEIVVNSKKIQKGHSLKKSSDDAISVIEPKTRINNKANTVEKGSDKVKNANKKITQQVLETVATAFPIQPNEKVIVSEEPPTNKILESDNVNVTSNIANILPSDNKGIQGNIKITSSKPNTKSISCIIEGLKEKNISEINNMELKNDNTIENNDLEGDGNNLIVKREESSGKTEKSIKKVINRKVAIRKLQDKAEIKASTQESEIVKTSMKKNLQMNIPEKKVLRSSSVVPNNAMEINNKVISQDLKHDDNIGIDKTKVLRSSRITLIEENSKGLCSEKESLLRSSKVAAKSMVDEKSYKAKDQKKNYVQNIKPSSKVGTAEIVDKTHGIDINLERASETNIPEHVIISEEAVPIIIDKNAMEVQELEGSTTTLTIIDSKNNVDNKSVVGDMDKRFKSVKSKTGSETAVIKTKSEKNKLACKRKRGRTVPICKPDSPVLNKDINSSGASKNKLGVQKKVTEYFSVKPSDNEYLSGNKIPNSTTSDDTTRDQLPTRLTNEADTAANININSATQKESSAYTDFCEAVSFEPSSTILNIQQPPSPLVKSSESLRNISTSVLSANQNSDQNKISPNDGNKGAKAKQSSSDSTRANKEKNKNISEEPCSLSNETLAVIQKENIPIVVSEDHSEVSASKPKDLTEIAITSTPISKVKVVRKMLRSKMVSKSRPITRSKRPKLVNNKRASLKRKRNLAERKNNTLKAKSITEDKTEEAVVVNETIENVEQNSLNNVQSVKRESKLDETENIIRLETIGTEIHTFHCKKCEKIFLRKSLLKKHEIDAHSKKTEISPKRVRKIRKRHACETCSETFPNARSLKLHKCPATENTTPTEVSITTEDEEPPSKRVCIENPDTELIDIEIEECKTEPDSSAGTDEQKDSPNSTSNSKKSKTRTFPCPHCSAITVTTNDLKVHISRVHEKVKDKICPYCSRGFACTGDLTRHIRLHTGEKPFKCSSDGCNMAFIASGDLIKHERTHLGDQCPRNFVCEYCEKTFKQRYEHDRHLRTAHAVALKLFQCQLCKKQFGRKDGLLYHLRLHAGIKPYTCKCGKQFTDSGNLRKHMNTKRHDLPPKKSRKRQQKPPETNEQ